MSKMPQRKPTPAFAAPRIVADQSRRARRGAMVSPIGLLTGVQKVMAARLASEETPRSSDKWSVPHCDRAGITAAFAIAFNAATGDAAEFQSDDSSNPAKEEQCNEDHTYLSQDDPGRI
jgi:hypothetical protein